MARQEARSALVGEAHVVQMADLLRLARGPAVEIGGARQIAGQRALERDGAPMCVPSPA